MMQTFSIVTIVFNDKEHILETMHSVISQTYKEIEYILIDGGSKDGTKEAILDYLNAHAQITKTEQVSKRLYLEAISRDYPTLSFKFLSEKDKGIYDAMNKGIALASKEWINFMNCGDGFYDCHVLEKVTQSKIEDCDFVYGDAEIVYLDQHLSLMKRSSNDLEKSLSKFGCNLIHQSFFFKTKTHQANLYLNNRYRIASDYELIYRLFAKGYKFCRLDFAVSIFHTGGTSDTQAFRRTKESLSIANCYTRNKLFTSLYFLFAVTKKIVKIYFPQCIVRQIIKFQKTQ